MVVELPTKRVTGTEIPKIRILVLRMEQHDDARVRANEYVKKKHRITDESMRTPLAVELLGDAVARELLAMACVEVEPFKTDDDRPDYPRIFGDSSDVNKLTADEVTALFGAYVMVQKKFGPMDRELDDEEVNAWIERLVEGGSALPLSLLPLPECADLCLLLARRASCLSKLLDCQQKNLPIPWESVPGNYRLDTGLSTELAAESTDSQSETRLITAEEAMTAAKKIIGLD